MNRRTSNSIMWLAGAAVALIVVGLAGRAFGADVSFCGPAANVIKKMSQYGEVPAVSWREFWDKDGSTYVLGKFLFVNPDTGEWTMLMQGADSGSLCTMRNGDGFVTYDQGEAS
jgi:hypothetical protein